MGCFLSKGGVAGSISNVSLGKTASVLLTHMLH